MGRALVLAGGGITGIAWESGVLAGLAAGGVDARNWDLVVGTSAGAYVGARLLCDASPDPLFHEQTSAGHPEDEATLGRLFGSGFLWVVRLSRRPRLRWVALIWVGNLFVTSLMRYAIRHGFRSTVALLRAFRSAEDPPEVVAARVGALATTKRRGSRAFTEFWTDELAPIHGWPTTSLIITAVDTASGQRVSFEASSGVTLAEAVAASTCLPLFLPPVELRGRRYMDGGVTSTANADIAAGHDEVWIVSPFGGLSLDQEVAALRSAGSIVHLIRPSETGEQAIGPGLGIMDPAGRPAAARAGFDDGRAAAESARPAEAQSAGPRRGLAHAGPPASELIRPTVSST